MRSGREGSGGVMPRAPRIEVVFLDSGASASLRTFLVRKSLAHSPYLDPTRQSGSSFRLCHASITPASSLERIPHLGRTLEAGFRSSTSRSTQSRRLAMAIFDRVLVGARRGRQLPLVSTSLDYPQDSVSGLPGSVPSSKRTRRRSSAATTFAPRTRLACALYSIFPELADVSRASFALASCSLALAPALALGVSAGLPLFLPM